MYSVVVGDDNPHWLSSLCTVIDGQTEFHVLAHALDGEKLLEHIKLLRPDIIVLDIIMPVYDGVYIVDYIRKNMQGYSPIIYIISGIGTDTVINLLNGLSVDFYSLKPVPVEVVLHNLKNVASKQENERRAERAAVSQTDKSEYRLKELAYNLGLVPHRKSTKYLVDALAYCSSNPYSRKMLTKVLYPYVAEKNGVNGLSVEKNIRAAITLIQKKNTALFHQIFAYAGGEKITNSEFIGAVIDYLTESPQ